MIISITKQQARRFLLRKQLLDPPLSLSGPQAVNTVFQNLRLIQYDPLNPCGRNPDLVLQSRIADYHPNDYTAWLYGQKQGIDCYDKELCIVPLEDFPLVYHRHVKIKNHDRITPFFKKYRTQISALMQRIADSGPISAADIRDPTRVDSGWGDTALFGRMALESLWKAGQLVIVNRETNRKYYDLPHRHFGTHLRVSPADSRIGPAHIKRRLRAVGILPISGTGGGWQGLGTAGEVSKLLKRLIHQKALREVTVEGVGRRLVIDAQDTEIISTSLPQPDPRMSFIAPLDNLIWDRQLILELFDFDYRWEVYTPLAKRKFGYYVLPILCGDRFIGRIEPVLTKTRELEIRGLWPESGTVWDTELKKEYDRALERFRQYLRADKVRVPRNEAP